MSNPEEMVPLARELTEEIVGARLRRLGCWLQVETTTLM
jgi:hypothetical protein